MAIGDSENPKDPEALVTKYFATHDATGATKIDDDFKVRGFRARAAIISVGDELPLLQEANRDKLQAAFDGNELYSIADCVACIQALIDDTK